MDFRLKHDSSLVCVGPSQSGKTTFVRKLLQYRDNAEIFDHPLWEVHWHYGTYFGDLAYLRDVKGYKIYEGIPQTLDHLKPYDIIVLDDVIVESGQGKWVTELFTRTVHHLPCFLIMLVQNQFYQTKEGKTRQINTKYMVLFKKSHDQGQVFVLTSQMYPQNSKYL